MALSSDTVIELHLVLGWIAIVFGVCSGAVMGLFFHREEWRGGYGSRSRRLVRLGHIAFFGMAFLNFSFALTTFVARVDVVISFVGSSGLILATITMPLICFFSAFKGINRALFSIPLAGTAILLISVFLLLSR